MTGSKRCETEIWRYKDVFLVMLGFPRNGFINLKLLIIDFHLLIEVMNQFFVLVNLKVIIHLLYLNNNLFHFFLIVFHLFLDNNSLFLIEDQKINKLLAVKFLLWIERIYCKVFEFFLNVRDRFVTINEVIFEVI